MPEVATGPLRRAADSSVLVAVGGFQVAQAALPLLLQNGGGALFFTGASASLRGKARFASFASAKAALRNLAQSIACEFGPQNIRF